MTSQRNTLIRSVAGLTGDLATGLAMAAACVWLIQYATLGIFLSFLLWLLATLVALALSQLVIHPTVKLLLSDRKLDAAIRAATRGAETLISTAKLHRTPLSNLFDAFAEVGDQAKDAVRSRARGFAANFKARSPA